MAWGEFHLVQKGGSKTRKVLEEYEVKGKQTSEEGVYEIETKDMEKSYKTNCGENDLKNKHWNVY